MGDDAPQPDKEGTLLSEKLFLLLIVGSLVVVGSPFAFHHAKEARTDHRAESAHRASAVTYLTHVRDEMVNGDSGGSAVSRSAGAGEGRRADGLIVAPPELETPRRPARWPMMSPSRLRSRRSIMSLAEPPGSPLRRGLSLWHIRPAIYSADQREYASYADAFEQLIASLRFH